MLPFLKLKQSPVAGLIIKKRAPDEPSESEVPKDDEDHSAAIHSCAHDLLKAFEAKDIKGIAEALADAFSILDSKPHDEGEHTNAEPHSYDAQNAKAGAAQND